MKLVTQTILAALLVIGLASTSKADPSVIGQLDGLVVDQNTGAPIASATVITYPGQDTVFTDAAGRFSISLRPGETSLIRIVHPSFETRTFADVALTAATGKVVTFELFARTPTGRDRDDLSQRKSNAARPVAEEPAIVGPTNERAEREADERSAAGAGQSVSQAPVPQSLQPLSLSGLQPQQGGGQAQAQLRRKQKRAYPASPQPMPQYFDDDFYPRPYPRDMFFQNYGTNRFIPTIYDNQSTFAADVDDASYTLVRQYLRDGNVPPADAIRIEEFVNHFDYGYRAPEYQKFAVHTSLIDSPFDDSTMLFSVGIKGREHDRRERKPLNLTFVIDVSGSMGYDNRMEIVKYALGELTRQLNKNDKIAIVTYGSGAQLRLAPTRAHKKARIDRVIRSLHPGGSTNAEAGLRLGYQMANEQFVPGHVNRIVICSDGVANVGLTNAEALKATIIDHAGRGITLSSIGVGMGNYNDVLLEKLAKYGDGRYAYVNDRREAHTVMVKEFLANMDILARDTKIQVEFNPEVVTSYRLLGYENRAVADHKFRDNREDGGEIGPGHEVTALYELVFNRRKPRGEFATINVRWFDERGHEVSELATAARIDRRTRFYEITPEIRLAVSAAKLAEKLKHTYYVQDLSWGELHEFAAPLAEQMPSEQTYELLELIDRAGGFTTYHTRK